MIVIGPYDEVDHALLVALSSVTGYSVADQRARLMPPGPGRVFSLDDDEHIVKALEDAGLSVRRMTRSDLRAFIGGAFNVERLCVEDRALVGENAGGATRRLALADVHTVSTGWIQTVSTTKITTLKKRVSPMRGLAGKRTVTKSYDRKSHTGFVVINARRGMEEVAWVLRFGRADVSALGFEAKTAHARRTKTVDLLSELCPSAAIERAFERDNAPGLNPLELDEVERAILSAKLPRGQRTPSQRPRTDLPARVVAHARCAVCNTELSGPHYLLSTRPHCDACVRALNPKLLPGPVRSAWRQRNVAVFVGLGVLLGASFAFTYFGALPIVLVGALVWRRTFGDDLKEREAVDIVDEHGEVARLTHVTSP